MPRVPERGEIPALRGEFEPADAGGNVLRSRDGRRRLEIHRRPQGVRDLHAAFLRLALEAARNPRISKAILAAWRPRPTDDRIAREWRVTLDLLKPSIAERLALVIVREDTSHVLKEDRELHRIGEILRTHLGRADQPARASGAVFSAAFFEVFKVLLDQWIRGRGPAAIGELMRRAGCSYPTVAEALRRLEKSGELARASNRSVQLSRFPEKIWSEILALSEALRRARHYADSSGRRPDPMDLYRRLQSMPHKHLAVGGVQAARHWDPHFDLNGLPRLDITLHLARGAGDWGFVGRLDPALKQVEAGSRDVVLVVHPLFRAEPRFEKNPKGRIDWADPVETLLDLHELRLIDQAEAMIRRLAGTSRR